MQTHQLLPVHCWQYLGSGTPVRDTGTPVRDTVSLTNLVSRRFCNMATVIAESALCVCIVSIAISMQSRKRSEENKVEGVSVCALLTPRAASS
jgi:hypothetical protein